MQKQRKFCDACQSAVADKQHAEVIRLLRTQQMGIQIRDEKLAWQLLKVSRAGHLMPALHASTASLSAVP